MKKKLKKGIIVLALLALAALIVSRFLHRADRAEEETRPTVTVPLTSAAFFSSCIASPTFS